MIDTSPFIAFLTALGSPRVIVAVALAAAAIMAMRSARDWERWSLRWMVVSALGAVDGAIERHVDAILAGRWLQRYVEMWSRVRGAIGAARARLLEKS